MFGWTRIATFAAVAAMLAMTTAVAGATSKPGSVSGAGSHLTRAGKIAGSAATRAALLKAANLRTRAGAARYLRSIGLNARHFVIQRGIRNYAGARCPGAGWSCTSTTHPVIQIASAGGSNTFQCATASCAVVQVAAATAKPNKASCVKTTGLGASCSISQANSAGNQAIVWEDAGKLTGLTQTALYSASITQKATDSGAANTACVHQQIFIDGSTKNTSSTGTTVALEAHQSIGITQDSSSGGNTVEDASPPVNGVPGCVALPTSCPQDLTQPCGLSQTQILSSTATSRGAIVQNENKTDNGPNLTLNIKQNQDAGFVASAHGPNSAVFTQTNNLSAVANSPAGAAEWQSSPNGGILAAVNQDSRDASTAIARQKEMQCEDAATSGPTSCSTTEHANPGLASLDQTQFGPVRKAPGDSSQTGNSNDSFTVTQNSRQDSDSGSTQSNVVSGGFSTSGSGTVNQTTTENGQTTQTTQSGQDVNSSINCTSSSGCTASPTITDHPSNPSSSSSASFSFTDTDPTVTFECQIDNSGYSTGCTSPWTYDNLADGSHTFSVKAKNGTGQVSDPATFTWTIAGGNANASTVQQLNPTTDPAGGACQYGFASVTGFQGVPQERNDTANLSAYDGQAIQLRFSFSTGDNLYNAFEGWYVKNIQVTGTQSSSPVTVFSDAVADGDTNFTASSDLGVTPGWHVTDRRNLTFGGPAWWYGNETTGTYQSNTSDPCTDSSANAGTITSPVFTLATNSQLSFDTLWQIESVNPSTFDLMDVQVIPVTSGPPIG